MIRKIFNWFRRRECSLPENCSTVTYHEGDDGRRVPHTMDARAWAKDWLDTIKCNPAIPTDEGTMIGWFANAIMAGYDEASRRNVRLNPGYILADLDSDMQPRSDAQKRLEWRMAFPDRIFPVKFK